MSDRIHDVAVIGAGISGLSAAKRLQRESLDVVVLEKSRGVGGRAATRRVTIAPEVQIPVDHGAQYFTVRDLRFAEQVARWQEEGVCFPWSDGFAVWSDGILHQDDSGMSETRFACRDGMSRLGKNLAEDVEIFLEFQVSSVRPRDGVWEIHSDSLHASSPVLARKLMISSPLSQTMKLAGDYLSSEERSLSERLGSSPCIAVMAFYEEAVPSPFWTGIQVRDSDRKLAWIAWDSSRRALGTPGNVAVLHGSGEFSRRWLEATREELVLAGDELLREAATIGGTWMAHPKEVVIHRWRYAREQGPNVNGGFLPATAFPSLSLIGDGLNGGRLEGAWLSGLFAAEHLLLQRTV